MKEAAQQRAARAKKAMAARKEAEKERQKREAILAKQKAFAEKADKEDRKAEKKPKKKSGGHRGFWSFLGFHKKKKYNEEVEKNMVFISTSILFLREQQHEK